MVLCPECGREVDELIQGACARCAALRFDLYEAPEVLPIVVCAHCGRFEQGSHWIEPPGDTQAALLERLRAAIRIHPDVQEAHVEFDPHVQDERHMRVESRLTGTFHREPILRAGLTQVRVRNGVCQDCSRLHGGYFEAVLQVRSHPDGPAVDLDAYEHQVLTLLGRLHDEAREGAFMSKIERVKGGLDFYVGSVEVARVLVRQLQAMWGADMTETAKLVGRREGRDLYRITLLVRLPAYAAGDFVRMDGQLYKVLGVDRRTLHLLDLVDWRVLRREPRRARELKVVGRAADEAGAVVVSQQGRRVQLLDPVTYRTVDVDLPQEATLSQEARVFREDERLWVVPPDYARQ